MSQEESGHEQPPWWHSAPTEPPVDSVLAEGMKLFAAVRDWAVESGAAETLTQLTQSAASSASAYLSSTASDDVNSDEAIPVVRCTDCPLCRALDALDHGNPHLAAQARSALLSVNAVVSGLIGEHFGDGQANT